MWNTHFIYILRQVGMGLHDNYLVMMLGNFGSWCFCGCSADTYHPLKTLKQKRPPWWQHRWKMGPARTTNSNHGRLKELVSVQLWPGLQPSGTQFSPTTVGEGEIRQSLKAPVPGGEYRRSAVHGRGTHVGRWIVIYLFLSSSISSVFGSTSISCQAKKPLQSHTLTSTPPPQMSGLCSNSNGNQIILLSRTRWQRCSLMITAGFYGAPCPKTS